MRFNAIRRAGAVLLVLAAVCPLAHGMEHVTLRNGRELDCVWSEVTGDRVRLYFSAGSEKSGEGNFLEVAADAVMKVEVVADTPTVSNDGEAVAKNGGAADAVSDVAPTKVELGEMLSHAGAAHNIDADLLASVVRAESGGQVRAVSRAGAQGLMQLMPGTAAELGVKDSFKAEQNIAGGAAYLDWLLVKYHDTIELALAAYNAGPAAVDRYHGVPPFAETRAYVARVIREFNRRKLMTAVAQAR